MSEQPQEWTPLSLAQHFHNLYERAAPEFGYETRTETRAFNPESSNGKLMIAVCSEILRDFNAALVVAYASCKETVQTAHSECSAALAAEREKLKRAQDFSYLCHQQLLAAQAAIAEIQKITGPTMEIPANGPVAEMLQKVDELTESVDLSALDKHDDEVRKPLVDACQAALDYAEDVSPSAALPYEAKLRAAIADAKTDRASDETVRQG